MVEINGDWEEIKCVVDSVVVVIEEVFDENDGIDDFEDEMGAYVDVFGRIIGDSGLEELVDCCLTVDDCMDDEREGDSLDDESDEGF